MFARNLALSVGRSSLRPVQSLGLMIHQQGQRPHRQMMFQHRALSTDTPNPTSPPSTGGAPIGWGSVVALVVLGTSLVTYYQYRRNKRLKELELKSIGRPAIGGPFSLVNHLVCSGDAWCRC
jgi:hypothetical protein